MSPAVILVKEVWASLLIEAIIIAPAISNIDDLVFIYLDYILLSDIGWAGLCIGLQGSSASKAIYARHRAAPSLECAGGRQDPLAKWARLSIRRRFLVPSRPNAPRGRPERKDCT